MRKFGLVLFLASIVNLAFTQYNYDFNQNCNEAYTAIINLKFAEGEKLIEQEKSTNPNEINRKIAKFFKKRRTIITGAKPEDFAHVLNMAIKESE